MKNILKKFRNYFVILLLMLVFCFQSFSQCNNIHKKIDKFTGKQEVYSSILDNEGLYPYVFLSKDQGIISMTIFVINEQAVAYKKGVILLFTNNRKINKPEVRINAKPSKSYPGWVEYSATFSLSQTDLQLLKSSNLTDCRLYIFDEEFLEPTQLKIKTAINCIVTM